MAKKTGTISTGDPVAPQPKAEDEEEVLVDPFLVRFRPRDDWRGEYGFDWVREGWDDYEERLERKKGTEAYKVKDKKASLINDEEWRKKKREIILDEHQAYNRMFHGEDYPRVDPLTPQLWDIILNALADGETENFYNGSLVPADEPMEYLYASEHVSRAVYRIHRDVSDAWTCDVYYENMANGDAAADDNKTVKLDHFVYFDTGERLSIKKSGVTDYMAYVYEENDIISSNLNAAARYQRDGGAHRLSLSTIARGLIAGNYNNYTYFWNNSKKLWSSISDRNDPCDFVEDEDFRKIASYKSIQYEEGNAKYDLMYRTMDGIVHLLATLTVVENEKSYKYFVKYENGSLKKAKINGHWLSSNQLSSKDKERINKCINDNVANNVDMTIDVLSKSKEKKDVVVTIGYPGSVKEVKLREQNGFKQKENRNDLNEHDKWHGHNIYSWKEDYEDTFDARYVTGKIEKEVLSGEKKYFGVNRRGIYMVPILSFGCDTILYKRTRFTFGGETDAPQKEPEKDGKYEIQLRIEGECKTLHLKSNKEVVVLDQTEIQNPKDRTKLTVTFEGKEPCDASIEATAEFDDGSKAFAGALAVKVWPTRFMYICFVKVKLVNENGVEMKMPSDMQDAIKDNVDALRNALSAVGIVPEIKEVDISVKISEIARYRDGTNWNEKKTVNGKQLDDVFINKYYRLCKNNPMLLYKYVVFFFPGSFYDTTAAYASEKKPEGAKEPISFVLESSSFSYYRTSAYQIAHELLHRLDHPHNFQMYHSFYDNNVVRKVQTTPFCFPIAQTTNIMDYWKLDYSLHKFQWELMATALDKNNRRYYEKLRKYYPNIMEKYKERLAHLEAYMQKRYG